MNDKSKSAAAGHTARPKVVIERTYRAKVEGTLGIVDHEAGLRVVVGTRRLPRRSPCSRSTPGRHAALRHDRRFTRDDRGDEANGPSNFSRGAARFTEIRPHDRLAITSVIDFLPGVKPYESTIVAEFFPSGETVRMVVTLDPMHDEEFTKMATDGFTSQLSKLDKRYGEEKR